MNQTYLVRTRAEFLNEKFSTNYKQYMRCTWKHPTDSYVVWMVFIDGERVDDYCNQINDDGTIITEEFLGKEGNLGYQTKLQRFRTSADKSPIRLIVRISRAKLPNNRWKYHILGKYELSREESDLSNYHVWKRLETL